MKQAINGIIILNKFIFLLIYLIDICYES